MFRLFGKRRSLSITLWQNTPGIWEHEAYVENSPLRLVFSTFPRVFSVARIVLSQWNTGEASWLVPDVYAIYRPPYWRTIREVLQRGGFMLGLHGTFRRISHLKGNAHLKFGELSSFLLSIISQFLHFIQWMGTDFVFYCVVRNTLCIRPWFPRARQKRALPRVGYYSDPSSDHFTHRKFHWFKTSDHLMVNNFLARIAKVCRTPFANFSKSWTPLDGRDSLITWS